jgi:acetyl esterase/lipase
LEGRANAKLIARVALVVLAVVGAARAQVGEGEARGRWLDVEDVRAEALPEGSRIRITLSRAPDHFVDWVLADPPRLVLDVAGPLERVPLTPDVFTVVDACVQQVRVGSHERMLRAILDLRGTVGRRRVRQEGRELVVELGDLSPSAPTPAPAPGAVVVTGLPEGLEVQDVRLEPSTSGARVSITLSRAPDGHHDFVLANPPRLVIDLDGPVARRVRPRRIPLDDALASAVRAAVFEGRLRLVLDLRRAVTRPAVTRDGTRLTVELAE